MTPGFTMMLKSRNKVFCKNFSEKSNFFEKTLEKYCKIGYNSKDNNANTVLLKYSEVYL